jgi:hypothetical protein
MYTHVSKCKNDKIKRQKKKNSYNIYKNEFSNAFKEIVYHGQVGLIPGMQRWL